MHYSSGYTKPLTEPELNCSDESESRKMEPKCELKLNGLRALNMRLNGGAQVDKTKHLNVKLKEVVRGSEVLDGEIVEIPIGRGQAPDTVIHKPTTIALERTPKKQATALVLKAVAFQKRQTFTNVCCICLCPVIMVIIASGLGELITSLINKSNLVNEFVYCSRVNATVNFT
jgi:hypothetical protein